MTTQADPLDQGPHDIHSGMLKIAELLETEESGTPEAAAQPAEAEAEAGPEYEAAEEAEYVEPEADDEGEPDDDEDDEPEAPEEPRFTVRANGEDLEVTLDELKAGYSRQSDYSRRMNAIAEQQKALKAHAEAIEQERAQYAQLLPQLAQQLEVDTETEPDWDQIFDEDPIGGVRLERQWRARKAQREEKLKAIASEQQRIAQERMQAGQAALKKHLEQEASKLPELIPEWSDQKVMKKETAELRQWSVDSGLIKPEHVGQITEASHVKMLRDSWLRSRGQAKVKATTKKTGGGKGRTVKPGTGSTRTKSARKKAENRLLQTGSWRDAGDVISQLDLDL